jgi:hypothetical protein
LTEQKTLTLPPNLYLGYVGEPRRVPSAPSEIPGWGLARTRSLLARLQPCTSPILSCLFVLTIKHGPIGPSMRDENHAKDVWMENQTLRIWHKPIGGHIRPIQRCPRLTRVFKGTDRSSIYSASSTPTKRQIMTSEHELNRYAELFATR